jgi:hypothetical protein
MAKGLYYYKLVSEYPEDVTKNCKLTITEIDSDFKTLKDEDIKSAEFIYDEGDVNNKTLILTRNNGEKLIVPLTDVTYNLDVDTSCGESGTTLTISYDGKGGKQSFKITDIVTADKLMKLIGDNIMTRVITDNTLRGTGRITHPLGINGVEKTGMYAPVKAKIDLTKGGKLPHVAKLGTRYVTVEYTNDYGYLYNGAGLNKISRTLKEEKKGWRVPTKADWDLLLNSIEPCDGFKNHESAKCHVELGKLAGKFLKSECGWLGQPECECYPTKPETGCTYDIDVDDCELGEDYISDPTHEFPKDKKVSPKGVDKFGMTILPAGMVGLDAYDRPQANAFKSQAFFWTTTHVYGDDEQDRYVKEFSFKKSGVIQEAQCPSPFYSVRLVKDYNGCNYFDSEYIDGVVYKTILFPETKQIWLASNYAKKEGFIPAEENIEGAEVAEVNNGEVLSRRKALFLNEWNGRYWEKKQMNEGDTVVVEEPCSISETREITYCWRTNFNINEGNPLDCDGEVPVADVEPLNDTECETITIQNLAQHNVEYRVFFEDNCNQDLYNTDDLVIERILRLILPIIVKEKEERISAITEVRNEIYIERIERISADTEIWNALNQEISDRESADTELWDALAEEAEARISGDTYLDEKIDKEIRDREQADNDLWDALNNEISRAISAETQLRVDLDDEIERAQEEEQRLWEALSAETAARIEADNALDDKIEDEIERATEREDEIELKLDEEIERAKTREDEIDGQLIDPANNPYTMSAAVGKDQFNLVLKSKDGNEDHFIKVVFDGNFGEI